MRSWPRRLARRVHALVHRDAIERELDEEMRLHLELEAEEIQRTLGVPAAEARRRARVAFGGVARYQEEHRDARGVRWLEESLRDVRHAVRGLRRSPGFTVASVLVLALGIGSTTAVFSAVDTELLDPADDGLAVLYLGGYPSLSTVDFRAIEAQQRSFTAVGVLRLRAAAYAAGGEAERVRAGAVTSGFFRALEARAARGRLLAPGDEPVGAPPVAVVSHALAERTMGGAATAVGRTIMIDAIAHTVVGVLPPDVRELAGFRADVWPVLQLAEPERRGPFGMLGIARLRPGVTFEAATRDVAGISERIYPLWAAGYQDRTARYSAVPIRQALLGDASRMLRLCAAAVGLVLLIAVANAASLMLVRGIGRAREVSLRRMLGASRTRLARLLVTESLLLAGAGAVAGIVVGALGLRALAVLGPPIPRLEWAQLDLRAVGFAVLVALLAGVIVGAYPLLRLLRSDEGGPARDGARTVGDARRLHVARSAFVVAQFAMALPLLAVAGLLLNSVARLQRVDPGFEPRDLLTMRVSLPVGRYAEDSLVRRYWTRALPRLREIPGVRAVALGSAMPPDEYGASDDNFLLVDRPVPPGTSEPTSPWPTVSAEYFETLGVPLLEGRRFMPADTGASPVAIVSRSWARRFYGDERVLGRTMIRGGCTECPPTTVVGVVDDVRYAGLDDVAEAIYSPVTENWRRDLYLFVRTTGPSARVLARVRETLRAVDPAVPLDEAASMEERLYATVAEPRDWALLLGGFAVAALALAAVGIFGMLSYTVSTRRREIGVRMALGARPRAIVWMVVERGLTHAILGAVLGLAAALVGTRSLATVLFGVGATDPATLGSVTLLLLLVALLACWLPARRAAAVDPVDAIRLE